MYECHAKEGFVMGTWDDLFNIGKKLLQDPIGEGKNLLNKGKSILEEKPPYYIAIQELENELKSIRTNKKNINSEVDEQAILAAGELQVKLKNAREKFDLKIESYYKKGISPILYKKAMYELTQDCNNAIHEYQPTLMASPGIWSQLKAFVNNVAEQYLGCKQVFEMEASEETVFSKNKEFKDKYNQVKEGQGRIEKQENDKEFKPNPNLFK